MKSLRIVSGTADSSEVRDQLDVKTDLSLALTLCVRLITPSIKSR